MRGSNLPLARLLGPEPSIESFIRFALDSSASLSDRLGTRCSHSQLSLKSCQRKFNDSISAIFFLRVNPFSSFSRPIAA